MTRLQPLNLIDFTGGVNYDTRSFQLAPNESPDLLNMEVDPQGGFYSRRGVRRWQNHDDFATVGTWAPRHGFSRVSGTNFVVFVTSNATVYKAGADGVFTNLSIPCGAQTHLADFESWGDKVYIVPGANPPSTSVPRYWTESSGLQSLVAAQGANFNDDYTQPQGGVLPQADLIEAHGGYLFAAGTKESGVYYPNRVRWSHPGGQVEDWHSLDYIDINKGGGTISAIRSFQDHLLIFKQDQTWALFGYDSESWQLVELSDSVGAFGPHAVASAQSEVYFYSAVGNGGVFKRNAEGVFDVDTPISNPLKDVTDHQDVWLGWVRDALWVSAPTLPPALRETGAVVGTTYRYDRTIGQRGAWNVLRPAVGRFGPVISDHLGAIVNYPLVALCGSGTEIGSPVVEVGVNEDPVDIIDVDDPGQPFKTYFTTSWQHGGWPELRKSWRRPRYILAARDGNSVELLVEVFHDYDDSAPVRSGIVGVSAGGAVYWRGDNQADPNGGSLHPSGTGFDWDDDSLWEGEREGAVIVRGPLSTSVVQGGGLGHARAVKVRIGNANDQPGIAWGVDAMVLKYIARRFTT